LSKQEILANYIYYGGIPEYIKQLNINEKQADLFAQSILKTIVEKDIFQRLNITNKHDFNKILDFMFDTVGSYVSPRSISDTLRSNGTIVDKQTVAKYLDALCEAYLIYKVPRFEIKGKGLLQTLNKYYAVDPCFAKVRLKKTILKDRSHWLENMVYLELIRRNKEVFIGKRNNLEVDFVAIDYNDYTSYYQVAWTTENSDTLERELASLRAIKDSTPKYLLTTDVDFNPVYDGIRKLNVIDWMLQNE
jgi:predicted AAA+ superfamily ATPase